MVFWDDLGFRTNYEVEADLDYPGDDGWTPPPVAKVLHPALLSVR